MSLIRRASAVILRYIVLPANNAYSRFIGIVNDLTFERSEKRVPCSNFRCKRIFTSSAFFRYREGTRTKVRNRRVLSFARKTNELKRFVKQARSFAEETAYVNVECSIFSFEYVKYVRIVERTGCSA